jgi:hypothetical protein
MKSAQLLASKVKVARSVRFESRTEESPDRLRFTSTQLSPAGLQARARFHSLVAIVRTPSTGNVRNRRGPLITCRSIV